MFVLALASIALFGYATHLQETYRWSKFTPMGIHSAITFVIVSGAIIAYVYSKHISGEINLSSTTPYVTSLFALGLSTLLWAASLEEEIENIQDITSLEGEVIREKIVKKFKESVENLRKLSLQDHLFSTEPDRLWVTSAEIYRKKNPWYKAIEWVDPSFHIQGISPLQENEKSLNLDLSHDLSLQKTLATAKKERTVKISRITKFIPQGVGFHICIPIFKISNFKGFVIGTINISKMLEEVLNESKASKFGFALFEEKEQKQSFFESPNDHYHELNSKKDIIFYNLHWVIKVWPSPEYLKEHTQLLSKLIFFVGVLLAFLLFSTIRSRQSANAQALRLQEMLLESNRHTQELQFLKDLVEDLQTCSSLKKAAIPIAKYCGLLLPSTSGVLYLANNKTKMLRSFSCWGKTSVKPVTFHAGKCIVFQKGNPSHVSGQGYDEPCEHLKKFVSKNASSLNLCLPLTDRDGVLGLLQITDYPYLSNEQKDVFLLPETLARQLSVSLSNLKIRDLLKDQAIRDSLTNLFNRRYFNEALERELHLAQRNARPLSIIMIDIDHFKKINDKHGHKIGDDVLKYFGSLLLQRFRKSDIPCRYGGEEFILILPETSLDIALQKAEQLRKDFMDIPLSFQRNSIKELSISLGVACFPQHGRSTNELISAVDKALYKAKKLGRNRIEAANNESTSTN
ncbi:MAG TPA: diguanylate cyclase [Alphaproteobacteria bacterium]|nr:diguanylate cyclase [Alphaproteobacteria bacterium]